MESDGSSFQDDSFQRDVVHLNSYRKPLIVRINNGRATTGALELLDRVFAAARSDYVVVAAQLRCQRKVLFDAAGATAHMAGQPTPSNLTRCGTEGRALAELLLATGQSTRNATAMARREAWLAVRIREAIDTARWAQVWRSTHRGGPSCLTEATACSTLAKAGLAASLERHGLCAGRSLDNPTGPMHDPPAAITVALRGVAGVASFNAPLWALGAIPEDRAGAPLTSQWYLPWSQIEAYLRSVPIGADFLKRNNGLEQLRAMALANLLHSY